jgi:mono/diheme cytochrome c family protein
MTRAARLVLATLVLLGAACAGRQLPAQQNAHPGELLFNGRVRPDVTCFKCHDGDASGTARGPDLGRELPGMTDAQIVAAIDRGPGFMPSFDDKLSPTEKQQIVDWLRQRFPVAAGR